MYNNFIHEKRIINVCKAEECQVREYSWRRKYEIQIRPALVEHYEKRVTSFIRQVDEKPVRNVDSQKQHSSKSLKKFVFRDREDWLTYTPDISKRQEASTQERKGIIRAKSQAHHVNRFQDYKQQFRTRRRQLQIHPSMTFSRPFTGHNFVKKRKNHKGNEDSRKSFKLAHHSDRITYSMGRNESHGTFKSTYYGPFSSKNEHHEELDYFRQHKFDNIQIEARQYEKQQEIVQKKQHFKTLVNMSLRNKNNQSRKEFRKILEKNGYVKTKKNAKKSENQELDHLSLIIQAADNQSY